jgi:hypothetical protein
MWAAVREKHEDAMKFSDKDGLVVILPLEGDLPSGWEKTKTVTVGAVIFGLWRIKTRPNTHWPWAGPLVPSLSSLFAPPPLPLLIILHVVEL